ncbi:tellurite resistance protein [Methylophaga nitratireducenticrescens]|uniref:TehB/YeaR-like domain-containing protein n=2 Tax=Methylophaga nitratireducenticrescens TaxID=754476 RepID=I1XEY0_METNJ|nr:tellurite resistance protein [Methylophaga nitratireducenticrescens]AUZ83131.1 tellurite resistance protein [Methylophaga nitratireducenticrescens]
MKSLPDNVVAYKRTPEFDESSVPTGLLNNHQTKEGVWGKIVVLSGKLLYTIQDPFEEILLDSNKYGVVEPTVLHQVKPMGPVDFYVEFYQ